MQVPAHRNSGIPSSNAQHTDQEPEDGSSSGSAKTNNSLGRDRILSYFDDDIPASHGQEAGTNANAIGDNTTNELLMDPVPDDLDGTPAGHGQEAGSNANCITDAITDALESDLVADYFENAIADDDDATDELLIDTADDYFHRVPRHHRQQAKSNNAHDDAATTAFQNDPNIVDWNEDDPQNPRNWPTWRKYLRIFTVIALTYTVRLGACMIGPSIPMIMADFGARDSLEAVGFAVSVYILGLGLGPLLWRPLSIIFGPLAVTAICNVCFVGFTAGCVFVRSLPALIACRFLAGVFGHCALATGPGVITDLLEGKARKTALMTYHLARVLGFIGGPFFGIWLGTGWRVLFWIQAGVVVAMTLVMVVPPCHGETSARVLLQRRTNRLRRENDNMNLRSRLDAGLTARDIFRWSIARPFQLLFCYKTCAGSAILVGLVYGCQFMILTTTGYVAKDWPVFVPAFLVFFGTGCVFGLLPRHWRMGRHSSDKILWPRVLIAGIGLCLGLAMYGWVVQVGGGERTVTVGPLYGLFSV
jgi:MFS family permease